MAIKTLLLCFIHGFKGDEETFYQFPEDLKLAVSQSNSQLNIETRIYPKYETRGDLALSVSTFKEWLTSQVTDFENTSSNPSTNPIHSPSISVILVAHSMGGFVAVDTLFSILDNRPVSQEPGIKPMFPLIQGVLAFDTPYNGLSRSMFAYGAFSQYQNISQAWNLLSTGTSFLTSAGARTAATQAARNQANAAAQKQLSSAATSNNALTRWSALAARTGTYGAIMAGGVMAYMHRDQILQGLRGINRENLSKINYANTRDTLASINYSEQISQGLTYVSRESIGEGFAWMAGHLKFVGVLMKTTQLNARLERLSELEGVGVKSLYTSLGENGVWSGGYFVPKRTFCAIPTVPSSAKDQKAKDKAEKMKELFLECPDIKAGNEIVAHTGMFKKDKNENYANMLQLSKELVGQWVEIDPRRVRDEWRPSGEQLKRTMSESKVWDDDGKVLHPPGGEGDEGQLDAILKSDEMPEGEDGGVNEEELKSAASVPLPVDEDVIGEGVLGEKMVGHGELAAGVEKEFDGTENQGPLAVGKFDEKEPAMKEFEKPLKVDDNKLADDTGKTSVNDAPQAEDTQESKKEDANSAPKKTWIGMLPGMSSTTSKEPQAEPKQEQEEQPTHENEGEPKKTWVGMISGMASSGKKQPESENQAAETKEEQKEENTEQKGTDPRKKWFGVV